MSDLRVRRARHGGQGLLLTLLLFGCVVGGGCGTGERAEPPPPAGVVLPEVGTLGRSPGGPGTIVVDVTADGRIGIGDEGPLSLVDLQGELTRRTADPVWREADRTSRRILLIRADASLPWRVVLWIMQVAADPRIAIHRIFLGAREEGGGAAGALGCRLPKDGPHPRHIDWVDPPARLDLVLVGRDGGVPAEPEDLLGPLRAAAGKRPLSELSLRLSLGRRSDREVPTDFVVRLVDVALRAGVGNIEFQGTWVKLPFDVTDAQALIDHVAVLRTRLATPTLVIRGRTVARRSVSEPLPLARGRLPYLVGARVEKEEWDPARDRTEVAIRDGAAEEELEEEADVDLYVEEPVIEDDELGDGSPTDADLPSGVGLTGDGLVDAPFTGPPAALASRVDPFPTRARTSPRTEPVERALRWLAAHQSPGGGWEAGDFGRWCDGEEVLEIDRALGGGRAAYDIGVTGLALCAFLGAGYTNRGEHPYAKTVSRGLRYLKGVQDAEGCFGPRAHDRFVYNHAAAALAMVEAYGMTGSLIYKAAAQKALDFILRCRTPGGGWRYGIRSPASDTSVTAWMALPLIASRWVNAAAEQGDRRPSFKLDLAPLDEVFAWIEAMTNDETGRTGYLTRGSRPERSRYQAASYPPSQSESTTAAAILLRVLLGEDPRTSDAIAAGASLLTALPPAWDVERGTIDHVYWYFGSLATVQIGGEPWRVWRAAHRDAIARTQRTDTDVCGYLGSWDPVGVWGEEGGRVASTALMTLCLEATYRYPVVFAGR